MQHDKLHVCHDNYVKISATVPENHHSLNLMDNTVMEHTEKTYGIIDQSDLILRGFSLKINFHNH